jgi:hypothetical protein
VDRKKVGYICDGDYSPCVSFFAHTTHEPMMVTVSTDFPATFVELMQLIL